MEFKRIAIPAALILVFALPVAAAWWFVMNPGALPKSRANHGTLLQPPLPTNLKGNWTVLVPHTRCDAQCRHAQSVALLVHRALGANATQVKVENDCRGERESACSAIINALGHDAVLVIVDPAGNAMMRYGAEVTPRDLLLDLERLLKASSYWRHDGSR